MRINDIPLGQIDVVVEDSEIRVDWKRLLTACYEEEDQIRKECQLPVSKLASHHVPITQLSLSLSSIRDNGGLRKD